jgi:hypothetical protein
LRATAPKPDKTEKKEHLSAHTRQIEKVRAEMRKVYNLFQTDQIPDGFGKLYRPLVSKKLRLNPGNSSRNKTPLCAREIFSGVGAECVPHLPGWTP